MQSCVAVGGAEAPWRPKRGLFAYNLRNQVSCLMCCFFACVPPEEGAQKNEGIFEWFEVLQTSSLGPLGCSTGCVGSVHAGASGLWVPKRRSGTFHDNVHEMPPVHLWAGSVSWRTEEWVGVSTSQGYQDSQGSEDVSCFAGYGRQGSNMTRRPRKNWKGYMGLYRLSPAPSLEPLGFD